MTETAMTKTEKRSSAENVEILPAVSSPPSISIDEAKSTSLNLISDTVTHLHGLMRSVARPPKNEEEVNLRLDPIRVNAACNCAKNIRDLLKLQVEVIKEMAPKAK